MKKSKKDQSGKIVLWQDQAKINEMEQTINNLLPFAEKLVIEYAKLPFCKPEANFQYILKQTGEDKKAYLLSLIPDDLEQKTGLKLNREKCVKSGIFDLPTFSDFAGIQEACKEMEVEKFEMFFHIQNKECKINSDIWQLYCDQQSIIAQTPQELELFRVWDEFLTSTVTFNEYMKTHCDRPVFDNLSPIQLSIWAMIEGDKLKVKHEIFRAITRKMKNSINLNSLKNGHSNN